jgi:hypothetical protein
MKFTLIVSALVSLAISTVAALFNNDKVYYTTSAPKVKHIDWMGYIDAAT